MLLPICPTKTFLDTHWEGSKRWLYENPWEYLQLVCSSSHHMESTKMSFSRWVDKQTLEHWYNGIYSVVQRMTKANRCILKELA